MITFFQNRLFLPRTRAGRWIIGISIFLIITVALLLLIPRQGLPEGVDVSFLPAINATLNGSSGVLLTLGYILIRRRNIRLHRLCMTTAFALTGLFLVSYVTYHALAGSKSFTGAGWIRPVYFTILISHILTAMAVLPLALTTLYYAWRKRFGRHRQIARRALPIWLYVSVTGVVVYWLLYHWR